MMEEVYHISLSYDSEIVLDGLQLTNRHFSHQAGNYTRYRNVYEELLNVRVVRLEKGK
jgi:hypothetical protein